MRGLSRFWRPLRRRVRPASFGLLEVVPGAPVEDRPPLDQSLEERPPLEEKPPLEERPPLEKGPTLEELRALAARNLSTLEHLHAQEAPADAPSLANVAGPPPGHKKYKNRLPPRRYPPPLFVPNARSASSPPHPHPIPTPSPTHPTHPTSVW